jgi:uncharacterized protein
MGARTLKGADRLVDQWKYLAVGRTALFNEERLYRGTQWVVFEPNDERLWGSDSPQRWCLYAYLFRNSVSQGTGQFSKVRNDDSG